MNVQEWSSQNAESNPTQNLLQDMEINLHQHFPFTLRFSFFVKKKGQEGKLNT